MHLQVVPDVFGQQYLQRIGGDDGAHDASKKKKGLPLRIGFALYYMGHHEYPEQNGEGVDRVDQKTFDPKGEPVAGNFFTDVDVRRTAHQRYNAGNNENDATNDTNSYLKMGPFADGGDLRNEVIDGEDEEQVAEPHAQADHTPCPKAPLHTRLHKSKNQGPDKYCQKKAVFYASEKCRHYQE